MKTFLFDTSVTMKSYNCKNWWIDSGLIRPIEINADDVKSALQQYREIVNDKYCVEISNNALKRPEPMYIDDKNGDPVQIGYVITGKTIFDNDGRGWVTQYIDLWVSVKQVASVDFVA